MLQKERSGGGLALGKGWQKEKTSVFLGGRGGELFFSYDTAFDHRARKKRAAVFQQNENHLDFSALRPGPFNQNRYLNIICTALQNRMFGK